jgi:hypothetical protein
MTQDEQKAWAWLAARHGGQLDGSPVTRVTSMGKYVYAFTANSTYRMRLNLFWRIKRYLRRLFYR